MTEHSTNAKKKNGGAGFYKNRGLSAFFATPEGKEFVDAINKHLSVNNINATVVPADDQQKILIKGDKNREEAVRVVLEEVSKRQYETSQSDGSKFDGITPLSLEEIGTIVRAVASNDNNPRAAFNANANNDVKRAASKLRSNPDAIMGRTPAQQEYLDMLRDPELGMVISHGPAGTGKTYMAVAAAVSALNHGEVSRIIITRPAKEAGDERLGFLPGDANEKMAPYLQPIFDALNEFIGKQKVPKLIEEGVIEITPIGFMRGRSLKGSFIILDEAQNIDTNLMKMFVTRIDRGSKMALCGDISQNDMAGGKKPGLLQFAELCREYAQAKPDSKVAQLVRIANMTSEDVVRHPLVAEFVEMFEDFEAKKENEKRPAPERKTSAPTPKP